MWLQEKIEEAVRRDYPNAQVARFRCGPTWNDGGRWAEAILIAEVDGERVFLEAKMDTDYQPDDIKVRRVQQVVRTVVEYV